MTGTDWIIVAGMLIGGILAGLLASRLVFRALAKDTRPPALQEAASPLSSLVLWGGVIIGMISALGVISPDALDQLPKDLIAFLPRVLSAAIIVILANVVSAFALTAIGPALARASAAVQRQVSMAVRGTIVGLAVLLAVAQLGIDTTVVNLGVAAIFFGLAASFTLLVGLGGRGIAAEVASTRTLRRMLAIGDHIQSGDLAGTVVGLHPTAIELETADGERVLVPSSSIASERLVIDRAAPPGTGAPQA
ncbi:MAG: mechanosensitive ion channel [Acidimicrobiales bacterium]